MSHRNPRKNDAGAYDKLRRLKQDFERVMKILEQVDEREVHVVHVRFSSCRPCVQQLKVDACLLQIEVFDAQLTDTALGKKARPPLPLPAC